MDFNAWWERDPKEVYWLEVTDRNDLGVDLNAPRFREDGNEYYGYSLIQAVSDNDIVFHYHKDARAITAWSRAAGQVKPSKVVWGAHGTVARNAGIRPYERPGWRLTLTDTQTIEPALSLDQLRAKQVQIQAIRESMETQFGKPLYFPFEPPDKRDLRPTQAYLTKLPLDIVRLFPALASIESLASKTS